MLRKTVSLASISLSVSQYVGPPSAPAAPDAPPCSHIDIEQVAAGLSGTTELRCLDNTFRPHSDWLFGEVKGQSRYIATASIVPDLTGIVGEAPAKWLTEDWIEDDAEKAGPAGETHILSHVESVNNGWTATQIWGFAMVGGERRYARRIVVKKGKDVVKIRLVYDWVE